MILSIFLITGAAAVGETLHPENATDKNDIKQGEASTKGFFDFLLSVTSSQDVYDPGETDEFEITAEATETFDTEGKNKVVEFYRCHDSGCDDPDQDEFLEADSEQVSYSTTLQQGQTWTWDVSYNVPSQESYYAVVGYVYDSSTGEVLTETPNRKIFEVKETSIDSDGDGVIDSEDQCSGTSSGVNVDSDGCAVDSDNDGVPDYEDECTYESGPESNNGCPELEADVSLSQTPSFTVDQDSNTVTGTLGIQNTGGADMSGSDIVEMQVRPEGSNPLSFVSNSVDTCDSDYQNNVHKDYSIESGDSRQISLQNQGSLSDGESYTVYFMTREACGGSKTEPIYNSYNAGTFTLDQSSDDTGGNDGTTQEQDVVQVSKPSVKVEDGTVTATAHFKNEGGDMEDSDILEMQVRPKGSSPLSFSSTLQVCDSSYPENVHRSYDLDSGEDDSTTLSTSAVENGEKYTVYLMTREDCGGSKVDPYYNSVRAGTVDLTKGSVDTGDDELPIGLILVGFGLLAAGGAVYRYG